MLEQLDIPGTKLSMSRFKGELLLELGAITAAVGKEEEFAVEDFDAAADAVAAVSAVVAVVLAVLPGGEI